MYYIFNKGPVSRVPKRRQKLNSTNANSRVSKWAIKPGVVAHACKPSDQKAEADKS